MNLNEQLINMVQQHPYLYDYRHKHFKNIAKKDRMWEKIAKEMNRNCEAIKIRWKNLRDGYTKYKKHNIENKKDQKKSYANWVWGPYLTFLDNAIQPRQTDSNLVAINVNEVTFNDNEMQMLSRSPSTSSNKACINASSPIASNSIDETSSSPTFPALSLPPPSKKRRFCHEDCFDNVLAYLSKEEKKDSIDLLFASYAKTLKKMKPRIQSRIKLQVAQIFAEAEMEDQLPENTIEICKSEPEGRGYHCHEFE